MNYKVATFQQLLTIAYHEPCSRIEKIMALMEIERRRAGVYGRDVVHQRIRRARG